ncbi:helix-turn-helix domain-containing protein [Bacillus toyonensis]|uniref:helix-turn-helix domain-containing protein n=1 Tax=Bacillus toyonensis TaxID=155322 RepID=UPI002E1F37D2|nr:helix-turn-helix domain-containing protein [Bacillus toyonensis]
MKKKQAITIIAGDETYKNLTTFKTIDELNKTVRAYKEKFAAQLNKNQLAVLNHLHNYSSKYFGVSFKSKKKIAEALHISRRTVIRACQHLESLGMIKQLEMKRKSDMRQTSNIIVIQPIIMEEQIVIQAPTKSAEICHTKKTKPVSLKQNIKDINKRKENDIQSYENNNDFIDYRVPQSILIKLATAFDPIVINESFQNALNIAKKAAKTCSLLSDKDVFNNIITNASVALFSKTHETEHNGTLMNNPIGYFTNTFKSMVYNYVDSFRDIHNIAQRKANANTSSIFYNWLEEDKSKEPSTNSIDSSLVPGGYYKLSKEEADEMGLY